MRAFLLAVALLTGPLAARAAEAPDTLVVKASDGSFKPGASVSWAQEGSAVRFKLAPGVDANAVATTLKERLATAEVKVDAGALVVSGVPMAALLDQLSTLSLAGGDDPLAGLAALGGAKVAQSAPEGGGSIRASKPTNLLASLAEHPAEERVEAEVLEVQRQGFPAVTLKLRIRRPAKAGPLMKSLPLGKTVQTSVAFIGKGSSIDFANPANQRNIGAYYLEPKDRVIIHPASAEGDVVSVDFIERKVVSKPAPAAQ